MNQLCKVLLVCVIACFAGCGGGLEDNPVAVEPVAPPVKAMLESVVSSGELGSGSMSIREALEKMKADGHAEADALLADLAEMETMTDADRIKAKAQEMIDSL